MEPGGEEIRKMALRLARLAGNPFPLDLLNSVMGTDAGALALLDQGFLKEDAATGWYSLSGQTDGDDNRSGEPGEVRELYQKLATAGSELRMPEDRVAAYHAGAFQQAEARRCWIRAAEKACEQKAYARAFRALESALNAWPWTESPEDRIRILKELCRCAQSAGNAAVAGKGWTELAEYARDQDRHHLRIEALGQLAVLLDDAARVTGCLKEAAELAERHLTPAQAIRPMLDYVDNLASRVRIRLARSVLIRVNQLADESGSASLLSEVRGWDGLVASMAGDHEAAAGLIEASLKLALDHDLPEQAALAYRRRANIAEYCSNYSGEVQAHKAAIQYCRQTGVGDQASCLSCLAYASFRTGEWQDAADSVSAVLNDPEAHAALKALALCVEGLMSAFRGQRRQAENQLSQSLDQLRLNGLLGLEFFAMMGQAWLQILAGNPGAATRLFDEVRALWRETDDLHDVIPALLFSGGHYAKEGHADRLADCIDILMTIQAKNPLDEARAALIALKGEHCAIDGDIQGFVVAQEKASRLFKKIGLPLEQAWTGISAATAGVRSDTTRAAEAVARSLGLRPFLAALETGGKRRPDAIPCDLTPRQREVLGCLAQGLTSKEIADRLSLSTRTVEMHVGRLLERMNCRTRSEAVRLASERGWLEEQR